MRRSWAKFIDWLRWGDPLRRRHDLLRLLEATRAIMDEHALTWWLAWGTLLGCVRHRALIPWDFDLDAGMTADSLERLRQIAPEIRLPDGLSFSWDEEGYGRFWLGPCWIDLVGYRHCPSAQAWRAVLPDAYRDAANDSCETYADYPEHELFPLRTGRLGTVSYPIPHDADAFLRGRYGDYRRLDRIPLAFSLAYHPFEMGRFVLRHLRERSA